MLDTPVADECLAQYCLAPEFNMIDTQVRPAPLPALRQRAQVRHRPHQVETAPVDEEARMKLRALVIEDRYRDEPSAIDQISMSALRMRLSLGPIRQPLADRLWPKGDSSALFKKHVPSNALTPHPDGTVPAVFAFMQLDFEPRGPVHVATTATEQVLMPRNVQELALMYTRRYGSLFKAKLVKYGRARTATGAHAGLSGRKRPLQHVDGFLPFYFNCKMSGPNFDLTRWCGVGFKDLLDELGDSQFASGVHLHLPTHSWRLKKLLVHFEVNFLPMHTMEQKYKMVDILRKREWPETELSYLILNYFDKVLPGPTQYKDIWSHFPHENFVCHVVLWGKLYLKVAGLGPLPTVRAGEFVVLPARMWQTTCSETHSITLTLVY